MTVLLLPIPCLELAIITAAIGALCVSQLRNPLRAWRWGLAFTQLTFFFTVLACVAFYVMPHGNAESNVSFQQGLFGAQFLMIDELNAPLLPLVGLLHFLTAMATGRTKMRRYSLAWSLTSEAGRLALFGCSVPWLLVILLTLGPLPGYIELRNRERPTRVYVLHMVLFAVLLLLGWWLTQQSAGRNPMAAVALLVAILIRCGAVPFHCWMTDWFEHASFGNALLFVAPLTGVYAAVRLVLPVAPDWLLQTLGFVSLTTALYASGMALVQMDARRFFAYLFLSYASLILVGLQLHTSTSVTGALLLWISVAFSLGGFGLTIRALEARFGRLSMTNFRGLYEDSPALAVAFLVMGLACLGFPGTLGFMATEILLDGAIEAGSYVGLVVVAAAALNGIAVVRAYFLLFTGARHSATVSVAIGPRERLAVLTLLALILGAGIFPQPAISSRHRAATAILNNRERHAQQLREEDAYFWSRQREAPSSRRDESEMTYDPSIEFRR